MKAEPASAKMGVGRYLFEYAPALFPAITLQQSVSQQWGITNLEGIGNTYVVECGKVRVFQSVALANLNDAILPVIGHTVPAVSVAT